MTRYAWVGDWRYVTREDAEFVAEANRRAIEAEQGFTDLETRVQEWVEYPNTRFIAIVTTEQMSGE